MTKLSNKELEMMKNLEPNSFRTTVSPKLVEGLRDDEPSSAQHGPPGVNQLICLIPAIICSYLLNFLNEKALLSFIEIDIAIH